MSATHSRSGASASKRRSTRSGAGRALGARHVVRGPLRRLTPAKPASRITERARAASGIERACEASGTERPACGSPACLQRPTPRESAALRTSLGCVGESPVHARSTPRQTPLAPSARAGTTHRTRSGRHRAQSELAQRAELPGHRGNAKFGLIRSHGRVAAGSCLPAAPTDPDVPNSGIRLLG